MKENYADTRVEEIQGKYKDNHRKIKRRLFLGLVVANVLALGGFLTSLSIEFTKSQKPAVIQYDNAVSSLNVLKKNRDKDIKLDYKSEEIKPLLESINMPDEVRKKSLDKAVEILEKDIEGLKMDDGVKSYIDYRRGLGTFYKVAYAGLLLDVACIVYGPLAARRNRNKRDYELDCLEWL